MPTTTYSGRKVDLLIYGALQYVPGTPAQQVNFSLGVLVGGQVCAGLVKLCQKVVVLLLTNRHLYDDKWGSDLTDAIFSPSIQKAYSNLTLNFGTYAARVVTLLQSQEDDTWPQDERIRTIQLNDILMDRSTMKISLNITVVSMSDQTATLIVPIAILP